MRKIFLVTLAVMAMSVALVAFAGDVELPENITIDQCAKKKAPVEFTHKAHFEYATCVDCHHTSEGLTLENAAETEVPTCGSCHIEPEDAETPICSSAKKKDNPYHINCIGCHKEFKVENAETTAPTKCNACHPKPEK
ncbi:MAG: cytochrome c family protein [Gemmatimonadales bacterium]|nr:cytochrome c family protein [Gemmatimonadales bacterium]